MTPDHPTDDGRDDGWTLADQRNNAYQARANSRQQARPKVTTLTARELEILLTCARYGTDAAPNELGISVQTAKNTLTHVYRKLEARGMAHAILILKELTCPPMTAEKPHDARDCPWNRVKRHGR
jgi:DNA-binding CsgD family transcriptional regulator